MLLGPNDIFCIFLNVELFCIHKKNSEGHFSNYGSFDIGGLLFIWLCIAFQRLFIISIAKEEKVKVMPFLLAAKHLLMEIFQFFLNIWDSDTYLLA